MTPERLTKGNAMRRLEFYRPEKAVPATKEQVLEQAEEFGVIYPADYIELASRYGGLTFEDENCMHKYYVEWDKKTRWDQATRLLHFGPEKRTAWHVFAGTDSATEDVDGLVAFAKASSPNYWCFDYRQTRRDPPIVYMERDNVYMDIEEDELWAHRDPMFRSVHLAANSFEDFINSLTTLEEAEKAGA